jgi:hypothetical protein
MELVGIARSYFGGFLCVCWSPDGKYIVVGGEDDLVTVYSFNEKRVVARGQGHRSWVSVVAFDPYTTLSSWDQNDFSDDENQYEMSTANNHLHNNSSNSNSKRIRSSSIRDNTLAPDKLICYRLGSVSQDTQLCLWDITEDILRPHHRVRLSTLDPTTNINNNNNASFSATPVIANQMTHKTKTESVQINGDCASSNNINNINNNNNVAAASSSSGPTNNHVNQNANSNLTNGEHNNSPTPTIKDCANDSSLSNSHTKLLNSSNHNNSNNNNNSNNIANCVSNSLESATATVNATSSSAITTTTTMTATANENNSTTHHKKGKTLLNSIGNSSNSNLSATRVNDDKSSNHNHSAFNTLTQRFTNFSFGSDKSSKGGGGSGSKKSFNLVGSSSSSSSKGNNNSNSVEQKTNSGQTNCDSATSTLRNKSNGSIATTFDAMKLIGTPACPRFDDCPVLEPLICKKIAHERLTALIFREDCFLTACQDGFVYTWARPVSQHCTQLINSFN